MKKPIVLSDREYEVMDVMWKQERELTINEISEISGNPKLTIPLYSAGGAASAEEGADSCGTFYSREYQVRPYLPT